MEEQLITFKTAKLAKEKEFDWKTLVWEYEKKGTYDPRNSSCYPIDYNNEFKEDRISIPTQSLLQKWLREEHNWYVGVHPLQIKLGSQEGVKYTWYACSLNGEKEIYDPKPLGELTYEEALEAGLQEVLKLLE